MSIPEKTTLFSPELVADLVSKVKGHSSLAVLSKMQPIPFNGQKEFTFAFDGDIDLVAENGAKKHGGATIAPVTIVPLKFEYGMRVSDEFMYASDEERIPVLKAFNDGFAKRVAAGLDLAAFHGVNPSTGVVSALIGNNCFDKAVTQTVTYAAATPDENIEDAIAKVETSDGEVTGIAISPAMRQALAGMTNSANEKLYPEFAFGGKPANLGATALDINKTVSAKVKATSASSAAAVDEAIVGDFENMFKWGYAKEIPTKIIEFGDPDNSGSDLAGHNQVYIRAEIFMGWGILDAASFARVTD